jgi:alpha-tubulin suppressor-like RCC1 family protein
MVVLAALLLVPPVGSGPALAAAPGTPWTWGSNSFGELGDGTTANHFTAAPVVGFAGADAVELAGGREHVVALRADGTVWTWGSSQYASSAAAAPPTGRPPGRSPAWPGRSRSRAATTTAWPCSATARSAPGA